MLVLSRKEDQSLFIRNAATGEVITVATQRIRGNRVIVGIEAPAHYQVTRSESDKTALKQLSAAEPS